MKESAAGSMSIYNQELHKTAQIAVRFSTFFLLSEITLIFLTLVVIPSTHRSTISIPLMAIAGFLGGFAVLLLVLGLSGLVVAHVRHYYGFDRERVHHRVPTNTSIL